MIFQYGGEPVLIHRILIGHTEKILPSFSSSKIMSLNAEEDFFILSLESAYI